ncbi:hypothetical protein MAR_009409 [Mya arenaria]|uniref:Uncharacterized protein n=1 Tax=Mya arenaria TaxID=6604 RepID=A0ABY7E2W3_MYAAR|nr:hypothetical protein MAR_009409 [Mya arenaria]
MAFLLSVVKLQGQIDFWKPMVNIHNEAHRLRVDIKNKIHNNQAFKWSEVWIHEGDTLNQHAGRLTSINHTAVKSNLTGHQPPAQLPSLEHSSAIMYRPAGCDEDSTRQLPLPWRPRMPVSMAAALGGGYMIAVAIVSW